MIDEMSSNLFCSLSVWLWFYWEASTFNWLSMDDNNVGGAVMFYYLDIKYRLIFAITDNSESQFMCINSFSQHAISSFNVD